MKPKRFLLALLFWAAILVLLLTPILLGCHRRQPIELQPDDYKWCSCEAESTLPRCSSCEPKPPETTFWDAVVAAKRLKCGRDAEAHHVGFFYSHDDYAYIHDSHAFNHTSVGQKVCLELYKSDRAVYQIYLEKCEEALRET